MAVNTPSSEHDETSAHRRITRTLRNGTQGMRSAGTLYLPQEPEEAAAAFTIRLERSVLTNIYKKTADTFAGRITKVAPVVEEGTPTQIVDIVDDFDNNGNDLATVMHRALRQGVDDGIVHFLIDSPQFIAPVIETDEGEEVPVDRTKKVDDDLGLRPFVSIINAENALGSRYDDDQRLIMFRFRVWDSRPDPDDEFNDILVEQVHVLDIGNGAEATVRKRIFEEDESDQGSNKKSEWKVVEEIVTDFTEIPLVTMYLDEVRQDVGVPLFMDLANLNIRHWQSSSDQSNIVHVIRVPILFAVGLVDPTSQKPQTVTIAANSVTHGEAGSTLEYVEHTGKAAEVGNIEIQELMADMVRMGVEIVIGKTGTQTATARALDQAEADTLMIQVATAVENAFDEIFVHLAAAFGIEPDAEGSAGGVNLNKDFNISALDSNVIAQLVQIWSAGGLSRETFWEEMQRWGILSEDFEAELEADKIEVDKDAAVEREGQMLEMVATASALGDDDDEDDDDDKGDK